MRIIPLLLPQLLQCHLSELTFKVVNFMSQSSSLATLTLFGIRGMEYNKYSMAFCVYSPSVR